MLSPTLSSHWVGLVTPVPGGLARPLVESLRNTVVCREHDIARWVPDPPEGLIGFDEAVRLALVRIRDADVATHWSNASVAGVPSDPMPTDPDWAQGTLYVDERSRRVDAAAGRAVERDRGHRRRRQGGTRGRWRGRSAALIDRLWGGPGLRRGRRSPHDLQLGDAVDFWRVEEIVDGELLRLRAEMKVPGRAWLDLGIVRDDARRHDVPPAGRVRPARACWGGRTGASVCPFHGLVFGGMQRNIARGRGGGRAASRAGQRRRTVVVTATIDGRRGAELNPKRTGGSTSASAPRSTPSHVAATASTRWRSVAAVELLAAGRLAARADAGQRDRRATGSTIVAQRGLVANGRGTHRSTQPERVAAADRDVGDERTAGEAQRAVAGARRSRRAPRPSSSNE